MSNLVEYIISFPSASVAESGENAEDLRGFLREIAPEIEARRIRTDSETMDMGASLAVVLAAPAAIQLAKGIGDWLRKTNTSKVTIKTADGSIVIDNISSKNAAALGALHIGKIK